MSLRDNIMSMIDTEVNTFLERVSSKYEIPIDDLKELWEKSEEDAKPVKKVTKAKTTVTKKEKEKEESGVCVYEFTRPPKVGEKCGVKTKDGSCYCSKHKKYENKEVKEKTVLPKKSIEKSASSTSSKASTVSAKAKKSFVVEYNKEHDFWWNNPTGFIIKSKEEHVVIGKYINEEIMDLTEDDIEMCQSRNLKYEVPEKKGKSKVKTGVLDSIMFPTKKSAEKGKKKLTKKDEEEEEEKEDEKKISKKDIEDMINELEIEEEDD